MKKIPALLFMLSGCLLTYSQGTNRSTTFSDYTFIAPQGWLLQDNKDFLSMSQSQVPGAGCLILLIPPQPSSGNLETDVKNVFDMMYPGWNYRNTGDRKYDLVKGFTAQGLEYVMLEAEMSKLSADGSRYDGYEDGIALVIRTSNKSGIISVRHNTSLMAHEQCRNQYETWLRFFNSISITNAVASKPLEQPVAKRIIGVWDLKTNGVASGEYVFAANGHYQLTGALGTSSTTTDYRYEYVHLTTYAFKGDGKYSIRENQLRLMNNANNNQEVARFRFDKVNHGGSGWIDRIHLLKVNSLDGKEYEVCYEKKVMK
ncbi:MAG: hypothetical protein ACXWCT_15600 [Flavitalea sp.]